MGSIVGHAVNEELRVAKWRPTSRDEVTETSALQHQISAEETFERISRAADVLNDLAMSFIFWTSAAFTVGILVGWLAGAS